METQAFILDLLRRGHSRARIAADLKRESNCSMHEAEKLVHEAVRDLVDSRNGVDRHKLLGELIESTKEVLEAAREAKDYATAMSAINLLAKLGGLLD